MPTRSWVGCSAAKAPPGSCSPTRQLWNRINSLSDRLDKVIGTLETGDGTAGRLLHDKALYENIDGTANELKQLIADIRKDPKKYLNVRVSIF